MIFNSLNFSFIYCNLQTCAAEFTCPSFFSPSVKILIRRILDPNPAAVSTWHHILLLSNFAEPWYTNTAFSKYSLFTFIWKLTCWYICVYHFFCGIKQRITVFEILKDEWFSISGDEPPTVSTSFSVWSSCKGFFVKY